MGADPIRKPPLKPASQRRSHSRLDREKSPYTEITWFQYGCRRVGADGSTGLLPLAVLTKLTTYALLAAMSSVWSSLVRYVADMAKAVGSAVALAGIPVAAWLGFVGMIQAATQLLGLL